MCDTKREGKRHRPSKFEFYICYYFRGLLHAYSKTVVVLYFATSALKSIELASNT